MSTWILREKYIAFRNRAEVMNSYISKDSSNCISIAKFLNYINSIFLTEILRKQS